MDSWQNHITGAAPHGHKWLWFCVNSLVTNLKFQGKQRVHYIVKLNVCINYDE